MYDVRELLEAMTTSPVSFDAPFFESLDPNFKASNRSGTAFPGTFGRGGNSADLFLKCVQYHRVGHFV